MSFPQIALGNFPPSQNFQEMGPINFILFFAENCKGGEYAQQISQLMSAGSKKQMINILKQIDAQELENLKLKAPKEFRSLLDLAKLHKEVEKMQPFGRKCEVFVQGMLSINTMCEMEKKNICSCLINNLLNNRDFQTAHKVNSLIPWTGYKDHNFHLIAFSLAQTGFGLAACKVIPKIIDQTIRLHAMINISPYLESAKVLKLADLLIDQELKDRYYEITSERFPYIKRVK